MDSLQCALRLHDPRCMGHQDAVPLPTAALATLAAALLNNDPSVYETAPGAVALESRILRWAMDEIGFPAASAGILTSGGSIGNLTALLAARQNRAGFDLWGAGNHAGTPLCVLVSDQVHYCVSCAVQMMGLCPSMTGVDSGSTNSLVRSSVRSEQVARSSRWSQAQERQPPAVLIRSRPRWSRALNVPSGTPRQGAACWTSCSMK